MNKKLIIPKRIVCADDENKILERSIVEITGSIISDIKKYDSEFISDFNGEIIHAENLTLVPGFIQTHIHLCQTLFRGLADDLELLDWLQKKIFPLENSHDENSLRASVQLGIFELLTSGTTTLMDMGTLRHQEVIFEELKNSGIRAFAGKCMIDENPLYNDFKSSKEYELKYTAELAAAFHNTENERIQYGFAPRFALSCSSGLLKETKEMMHDFPGSIFHTHSSENKNECNEIKRKFGKDNVEYFDSIGVLDQNSVLAHCVHLSKNEIEILKDKEVGVAHCPSSNLKLGSGIAKIPELLENGIKVSLGADGAPCNNNLSILSEMKLASLIQKPFHGSTSMDAKTIFRLATIEGANALNIGDKTGSIEVGKKADLVMLNLESPLLSLSDEPEDIYSNIVYSATRENVIHVIVDGGWIVKDKKSLIFDEEGLFNTGKSELRKLLKKI